MMLVSILCTMLRVGISCGVFGYFVYASLKSRFRYDVLKTSLYVALIVVITMAVTVLFLCPHSRLSNYYRAGILLWIVSALVIVYRTIKGTFYEILFIVLVSLNLYVNIMAIAKVLVEVCVLPLPEPLPYTIYSLSLLLLYLPFIKSLLLKTFQAAVEFDMQLTFWKFIWIVPVLTYAVFYVKIINDYWRKPFGVDNDDILFCILWSAITYVFFWITLQMIIQTYKGMTAINQANMISTQLRMQGEQYGRLIDNIENTSRLRHDWRHHLLTINGMAEEGDMDKLKAYIRKLSPESVPGTEIELCENHTVDVILSHYTTIAAAYDIKMDIKAVIPPQLEIDDTDLCIVFGNLVENAVEACINQTNGKKYIQITACMKGFQLVAMVKNTYQNTVSLRDGLYYSTKHEGMGVGISSVVKVVEKHRGFIEIDNGKEYFKVALYLNT